MKSTQILRKRVRLMRKGAIRNRSRPMGRQRLKPQQQSHKLKCWAHNTNLLGASPYFGDSAVLSVMKSSLSAVILCDITREVIPQTMSASPKSVRASESNTITFSTTAFSGSFSTSEAEIGPSNTSSHLLRHGPPYRHLQSCNTFPETEQSVTLASKQQHD